MSTTRSAARATRRVLVVHYHFLPVHNVAVKQLVSYVRRLSRHGWAPTVLTRDWQSIDDQDSSWGLSWEPEIEQNVSFPICRVPAPPPRKAWHIPESTRLLRQAVKLARLVFGPYPDGFVGWIRPAIEAAHKLAPDAPFDAVMTYCPPETNHIIGSRLSRELAVPWVPFFGDLWEFLIAPFPSTPEGLLRKAYHRRWMARAAACAAVSPYMAEYLKRTYGKRTEVVLAGFDPGEFTRNASRRAERPHLVISHVGSLYPRDQRPTIFFDGVDELIRRYPEVEADLRLRFVGSKCDTYLRDLVRGRPCERVTSVEPKVDSTTAISIVESSDALLAFNCSLHRDRHGTMSYPTKIFEAFGARRPVLAVPPDGDWVDALLAQTGAGTSARNASEVADVLREWHLRWTESGSVPYACRDDALSFFTVDRQVEHLAALLDLVVEKATMAHRVEN